MFEDFIDEMRRFQRELNRSFGEFWDRDDIKALPFRSNSLRTPLTDLEETDKEVIARFDVPGVEKKDIQLNVTSNRIEVKVEKKQEAKVEKKGMYKEERSYRGFYRAMMLPSEVVADKAKASYKNGVLEVTMPKAENKKKSKIDIE